MALKAQECILAIHAGTIIHHTDQLGSSTRELHNDPPRACIDAVFDEFFDHGGRSFHDFACRNLARYFI